MNHCLFPLVLTATFALSGCVITHELDPTSPLPRGIARDPRLRGWEAVRVTTVSHDPDDGTVVATFTPREGRGGFEVRGSHAAAEAPGDQTAKRWTETYNDVTDVLEYASPDPHFIRVVLRP